MTTTTHDEGLAGVAGAVGSRTLAVVDLLTDPIQRYTRRWMLAPETNGYGTDLGFATGVQFWIVGRAGVLGSCPADVAAAAIAFEPVDVVRRAWNAVPSGLTHHDVAVHYAGRPVAFAERVLADVDPDVLGRVDRLGRRVVDAAPASLGLLFAGWRLLEPPGTPAGRAGLTLHLLRELRGAAHICAIAACGLSPLDAILAAPHPPPRTGPGYAERMGWVGPFRDPEEFREARLRAEDLTSQILVPAFGVLAPDELEALLDAVTAVCAVGEAS